MLMQMGIGSVFWPLMTEVFAPEVREAGATLMNALQWTQNILLSFSFLYLEEHLGQAVVFWAFGSVGIITFACIFFFVKETK